MLFVELLATPIEASESFDSSSCFVRFVMVLSRSIDIRA